MQVADIWPLGGRARRLARGSGLGAPCGASPLRTWLGALCDRGLQRFWGVGDEFVPVSGGKPSSVPRTVYSRPGVLPAVPSEDFGREALLAEGLVNDHDAGRYEVALEAGKGGESSHGVRSTTHVGRR